MAVSVRRSAARSALRNVLIAALPVLAGCQVSGPRITTDPPPTDSSAELTLFIGDQVYVTAEAGYRAVYALWKGASFEGEFDALTSELSGGDIISPDWNLPADASLNRAAVGYMICRACDIRSGINWQITGQGRYAWRELLYRRIALSGGELGLVSGGEFLGILKRADDYLARRGAFERIELGSDPSAP